MEDDGLVYMWATGLGYNCPVHPHGGYIYLVIVTAVTILDLTTK